MQFPDSRSLTTCYHLCHSRDIYPFVSLYSLICSSFPSTHPYSLVINTKSSATTHRVNPPLHFESVLPSWLQMIHCTILIIYFCCSQLVCKNMSVIYHILSIIMQNQGTSLGQAVATLSSIRVHNSWYYGHVIRSCRKELQDKFKPS